MKSTYSRFDRFISSLTLVSFITLQVTLTGVPVWADPVDTSDPLQGDSVPLDEALAGQEAENELLNQMTTLNNALESQAASSGPTLSDGLVLHEEAPVTYDGLDDYTVIAHDDAYRLASQGLGNLTNLFRPAAALSF